MLLPNALKTGDTFALCAPCSTQNPKIEPLLKGFTKSGFQLKPMKNIFSAVKGYVGQEGKRLDDLKEALVSEDVQAITFGGGFCGNELFPDLPYELFARERKIMTSMSGGTAILNAVTSKTGLVTFLGMSPGHLAEEHPWNHEVFRSVVMEGLCPYRYPIEDWQVLLPGHAEGKLIGGNLQIFAWMAGTEYLCLEKGQPYILFLEDLASIAPLGLVDHCLHHLKQTGILEQTVGIVFGSYAPDKDKKLCELLVRECKAFGIPVMKCDDFGHRKKAATFPLGIRAVLDTEDPSLTLMERAVR
ncbi:MAG: LD-carboxypeptidase [Clostridia bacterium]|nr:LD-carboxypeptidase [Clostridia bacterium]